MCEPLTRKNGRFRPGAAGGMPVTARCGRADDQERGVTVSRILQLAPRGELGHGVEFAVTVSESQ